MSDIFSYGWLGEEFADLNRVVMEGSRGLGKRLKRQDEVYVTLEQCSLILGYHILIITHTVNALFRNSISSHGISFKTYLCEQIQ